MNTYLWLIAGITICLIFFWKSYSLGTKKSFQNFLSLLIPIILSGTATRISRMILPNFVNISYYIAGMGTLLFYIVLAPILTKEKPDRYRKITKISRWFAGIIGVATAGLFLSFICFFINLFVPTLLPNQFVSLLTMPIKFLWLFPY
ncbi:MAG: hypothetical protein ACRCWI_03490 [Brevinema sp.]